MCLDTTKYTCWMVFTVSTLKPKIVIIDKLLPVPVEGKIAKERICILCCRNTNKTQVTSVQLRKTLDLKLNF